MSWHKVTYPLRIRCNLCSHFIPKRTKHWCNTASIPLRWCFGCWPENKSTSATNPVSQKTTTKPHTHQLKYVDVGTTPTEEQCACFGFAHYEKKVKVEVDRWIPFIKDVLGNPPVDSDFVFSWKRHVVGGREYVVQFEYLSDNTAGTAYAHLLETRLPKKWTDSKIPLTTSKSVQSNWKPHICKIADYCSGC